MSCASRATGGTGCGRSSTRSPLGAWSAAGAQRTFSFGLGWLSAILLGTITAVGGAMVRDVVLRRVPGILGGNTLYATSAADRDRDR
ncbi:MAG TPA: TRIC cation channel family protein [Actinopolymorphaceae bacterium]